MASPATTSEPSTAGPAIETRDLRKHYGSIRALDGLDLRVEAGSFFGLLGPNGAGKTTAVGILTTLVRATSGEARLLGRDAARDAAAVRRDVGVVFQESTLDPELTGREHLDLYARLYHLADRRRRVAEVLELVGLQDADADRRTRGYSGGMKRRLEIGRGLLHRPRVLFLDEPTLGLDVAARAAVWRHLRALRDASDTTLFMTTHSMDEAESLCDEVAIVDRGRVVARGAPEALVAALGGDVAVLVLERAGDAAERLARIPGVRGVTPDEGGARLRVTVADGPRQLARLVEAVLSFGVVEVALHRPGLEHVFLHHTGHAFESDAMGPTSEGAR